MKNKKTDVNTDYNKDGMDNLDDALGAFGLAPPKHYRDEDTPPEEKKQPQRRRTAPDKKPATRQERVKTQNKKRKRNKLKRRIIAGFMLTVGIVAVIAVLCLTVLFKIQSIEIVGNERYAQEEILAVLPISEQDNLFASDVKGAAEKLESTLPYIYSVELKRKLPDKLVVTVQETPKVYAILTEEETYTLIDDGFKVLETGVAEQPEGAVVITNAAINAAVPGQTIELSDEKITENLKELAAAINRLQLDEITGISSIDINNNFMVYDNRITYKLGPIDNLDNKIYAALTATEKLNESNPQVSGTMTVTGDKQIYFTEG